MTYSASFSVDSAPRGYTPCIISYWFKLFFSDDNYQAYNYLELPGAQQQNKQMKTSSAFNMEQISAIKDSINLFEDGICAQSPICRSNSLTRFRMPFNEHDYSEGISIEQDINGLISHSKKYKCYRCFGLHSPPNSAFSLPLCDECDGAQYISEAHPLAIIFDRVLKAKLPILAEKKQPQTSSYTYIEDAVCGQCSNSIESEQAFFCQSCSDYILCLKCFAKQQFNQHKDHPFAKKKFICQTLKLKQNLPPMKKISEELSSDENCTIEEDEMACSNCLNKIEECYEICPICEANGIRFIICDQCSKAGNYLHNSKHELALYTVQKESKLPALLSKPSESKSIPLAQITESQSQENHHKSRTQFIQSIVFFPQIDLDDSTEMQQDLRLSHTPPQPASASNLGQMQNSTQSLTFQQKNSFNPESPAGAKKQVRNGFSPVIKVNRNQSLIKINLQESDVLQPFPNHSFKSNFQESSPERSKKSMPQQKKSLAENYYFVGYECDICGIQPIVNNRYHCNACEDYDVCEQCYFNRSDQHDHSEYQKIEGIQILKQREERMMKTIGKVVQLFDSKKRLERRSTQSYIQS